MNGWEIVEEADTPDHDCGPYCHDGLHAVLAESTARTGLADDRDALMGEIMDIAGVGECRVVAVYPAPEAPVDDPEYPNMWLTLMQSLAVRT